MATTLGDLRSYSKSRAGTMYTARPRKSLVARPDDAVSHLPHEVVGILVAQALDWDTQRIVEAFTVALKHASEQSYAAHVGETERAPDPAGKLAEPAPVQRAPERAASAISTPAEALNRLDAQGRVTDASAQPADERQAQSIADARAQFITLGELVLEAIEAVDRSGGEAVD